MTGLAPDSLNHYREQTHTHRNDGYGERVMGRQWDAKMARQSSENGLLRIEAK